MWYPSCVVKRVSMNRYLTRSQSAETASFQPIFLPSASVRPPVEDGGQQDGELLRVVLQIRILDHGDVAGHVGDGGPDGGPLAAVDPVLDHLDPRVGGGQFIEDGRGPVPAAIVHADQLDL